jgi:hypothetical protein
LGLAFLLIAIKDQSAKVRRSGAADADECDHRNQIVAMPVSLALKAAAQKESLQAVLAYPHFRCRQVEVSGAAVTQARLSN